MSSRSLLSLFLKLVLLLAVGAALVVVWDRQRAQVEQSQGVAGGFPSPVAGADVPLLGVNVDLEQYDQAELSAALERIHAAGITWVRQTFHWSQIEPTPGRFDWSLPERVCAALADFPSLQMVAVLDDSSPTLPSDPDRFAAFGGAFAARYEECVDNYQVWDEPNLATHWGGGPVSPPAYADLLARTAQAIRAADPDARILLAGLAPTVETGPHNLSDVLYLEQLYQAGAAPYFDIVAGKPYGFHTGPDDRRADEDVLNFSRLVLLREVMLRYGDSQKAIWASHWGWNALPPDWSGAASIWGQVDETTQAAYTVSALDRVRREWPWVGAMILTHFQPACPLDDPRWGFALVDPRGRPRPVYDALAAWSAALPDAAPVGGFPARNRWATYEGAWQVGVLGADIGADGDRAVFRFDGTSVALTVRRGPYRGFLTVTVDGRPANRLPRDENGNAYLVLYDTAPGVATVPLATGLSPGPHTVQIVADGGAGQWALVDWRVGEAVPSPGYWGWLAGLGSVALVLCLLIGRDLYSVLKRAACDASSVTGFLTAVAISAPFYLYPEGLFYRGLSLSEVLLLLCTVGWLFRQGGVRVFYKMPAGIIPKLKMLRPLDWVVVGYLLVALVAAIPSADPLAALFELRTVFLFPAVYYALLRVAPLDDDRRWHLVDGVVAGAVIVALVGIFQYITGCGLVLAEGGWPRTPSVYHSPNSAALYLERVWPLLVAVGLTGRPSFRRSSYRLAGVLVTLALVFTLSRGALLLGLPAAMLVMGCWAGRPWRRWSLAMIVLLVVAIVPLMRLPRFAAMLNWRQGSTFFRLAVWRSTITLLREHPWFGVGPGGFLSAYRTRYVLPSAWEEFNLDHPHNIYLDHWARLGIAGLLIGGIGQWVFWRAMRRWGRCNAHDPLVLGMVGSMAAILAHGWVDNTLFAPDLALVSAVMWALLARVTVSVEPPAADESGSGGRLLYS